MLALTAVFLWGLARYKQASAFWQWVIFSVMETLIGLTAAAAVLRFGVIAGAWGIIALLIPVIVIIIFEERSKGMEAKAENTHRALTPATPPSSPITTIEPRPVVVEASHTSSKPLPAPPKDDERIIVPIEPLPTSEIALAPPSPLPPLPQDERDVVPVTPEELWRQFTGRTDYQAQRLMTLYLGKWMRVAGTLGDVTEVGAKGLRVGFELGAFDSYHYVHMYFSGERQCAKLAVMPLGHSIGVLGKIDEITSHSIRLMECELLG